MIEIKDKAECCGCEACVQACPKNCISMLRDEEGFLYPKVDLSSCINCGLCEKVCPYINKSKATHINPKYRIFATKNANNTDIQQSASGAIFPLIAREILKKNGVVFGARWNENWEVVHDYCDNESELKKFQGSKYVQSRIGDSFIKARTFLNKGRFVLFSGTPCQILALKKFLRKDYANLLTVDIFCHSITSPKIWQIYLNSLLIKLKKEDISDIKFRKKTYKNGKANSLIFSIEGKDCTHFEESFYNTSYGKAFGSRLTDRPSCNNCPAAKLESQSDITLGDFWGAQKNYPSYNPHLGLSLYIAKTDKGLNILENITINCQIKQEVKLEECLLNGGLIWENRKKHKLREKFFKKINKVRSDKQINILEKYTKPNIFSYIKNKIYHNIIKIKKFIKR